MKRLKLILSLIATIVCVALIGFITYSWYINIDTAKDMEFEILQIQSLVSLYEGKDRNHNGLTDEFYDIMYKYRKFPKPNYCEVDLFNEMVTEPRDR